MKRSPRSRLRSVTIVIQPARREDMPIIVRLVELHGEGKVDLRGKRAFQEAIDQKRFHIYVDLETDEIIGFAGVYPYTAGPRRLGELGTSLIVPPYRRRGIADFSVAFRSINSMSAEPGLVCVSEIYPNSLASRTVLERQGFRVVDPDRWQNAHALEASADPVLHLELGDPPIQAMGAFLLPHIDGLPLEKNGLETYILLGDAYWLAEPKGRQLLVRISRGDLRDLRPVGDKEEAELALAESDPDAS